ncbi:hypothetical protein CI807_29060 [Pseudomonas sp. NS1(2017)]|uniref:hypothetical protein n=1 Tax=Pseudomonas sp. NS1(2017) TaxID=2025658 RepID=UPI000BA223D2|nr:hypothetical protein [Pseudomonas sp. NS1(2017)]ASV40084.1 hypothetical protein CI807_29060 [Pseudomonas sp. NS1(2017)]
MSVIAANHPAIRLPTVPDTKPAAAGEEKTSPPAPAAEAKPAEAVAVTISTAGFKAARNDRNKDIDSSNLKDNAKQLLKMIRELKKQIADKQAELAALNSDTSMTPEQRKARMDNLRSALATLQSSLSMAHTQLGKAMKGESAESQMEAMSLAAK